MKDKYVPAEVEAAAQQHWAAKDMHRVTEDASKPKFYACSMLPYPSGKLHMGHVRNYTINDMMTRQLRMKGYNVLMPMGWDAFGLPAENAAIKNKVPPAKWTYDNIASMKAQMHALGLAIDWSRELTTCHASYYRWNQWLFVKMLEKGIAYEKTQVVNWDPVDQTVLANEQVIDGRGWRSGALVEKREIPGYYLAITKYAEELLANVTDPSQPAYLSGWPERVRSMQEHWIGKSEGVRFAFPHDIRDDAGTLVGATEHTPSGDAGRLWVFTTRADTIMGVTFCAVAPEHPLAARAAALDPTVAAFVERCKLGTTTEAELATREKEGVRTSLKVMHPITDEPIDVWVGNYVLMSYGDGAVMGVPGHDERDFAFALKYGIPITQVIAVDGEPHFDYHRWHDWYADKTRGVVINSDNFSGLNHRQAVDAIAKALHARGLGDKKTTWRLRDWGISRQRYWGTPVPTIHCATCGVVPVPEKDLPVVLPEDLVPDGSGNPLNKSAAFLKVDCPRCAKPARRETDTMDTFVDSAWYALRYCSPGAEASMIDGRAEYWMAPPEPGVPGGMDQYIGGIEHAVLHLLYARFWTKVMRDLGLTTTSEPFRRLLTQGMVLNEAFSRTSVESGREYFWAHDLDIVRDEHQHVVSAVTRADGRAVQYDGWTTMSKSKNNGVDPQSVIDRYGADTARVFVMFASPPEQTVEWSDSGVDGAFRFLRRLWGTAHKLRGRVAAAADGAVDGASAGAMDLRREVHTHLRQIDADYTRLQYNTVVSGAMKILNAIEGATALAATQADDAVLREAFSILVRTLYPAAPHATYALWDGLALGRDAGELAFAPWPVVDEAALVQARVKLVLQINGKARGTIEVAADAADDQVIAVALASPEFAKFGEGKKPKFTKIVPGRLISIAV